MLYTSNPVIKHKTGLLNLAQELWFHLCTLIF